jgi:glycosyltransferase involved in cell wall biosynthesis
LTAFEARTYDVRMSKSMRIGVLAPPWLPVPPPTYGGTELIADILCRGFKAAGHEAILFASGDSTCPVRKISAIGRAEMPPDKYKEHLQIAALLRAAPELGLDIVHSHLEGIQPYAHLLGVPVVCTLHVDMTEQRRIFLQTNAAVDYVAVSEKQGRSFPFGVRVIRHGIEIERYRFSGRDKKKKHLLFLGEICRRKGADVAVRAWMALARPVKIAGWVPPVEQDWFKRDVMSRVRLGSLEFLGPVGFEQKVELLGEAAALLCPVRWEEPFGLVAAEAMACGTPVIAIRRGAMPELVEHGVTGFLCDDEEEVLTAIERIEEIDPEACRRRVEELFDAQRMVREYLEMFESKLDSSDRRK